ncbi:MAG TPA: 1-(5-phosphoribosyl)-5-[(5-phosphoribosylamino)methylideneamino]imidazole-4-carboxamide isomerase [Lentisphaeria bacterium]|nr:MAG: 1-(5-phosphoribosyl)-5-[(5-phosphoribosylamino)methylideneamino]imidazole-4-carboxamide isomerase [Lentisphaerae bacterium GWF2_38_69]HBM15956.1 1-(5-phosphoribosyl)-5-[(5-phosphoribosylamino)methylideneamino]imidazole-4-carboxamide isomerase [Lentisphaeria bacterium]
MIIIPAIDIVSGKCVRLYQGDYNKQTIYSDSPEIAAKEWQIKGAPLLHIVDLDGAKTGRIVNIDSIKRICSSISIPCELGGGIRTPEEAQIAFDSGISRVIIGTSAIKNPKLIPILLDKFGKEKIILGLDAREGKVAVDGWMQTTGILAIDLAKQFASMGVQRFIYTDISKDGALSGTNMDMISLFCSELPKCSIIASGGVGSIKDLQSLLDLSKINPNLEGIIVGKALYEKKISLKKYIYSFESTIVV